MQIATMVVSEAKMVLRLSRAKEALFLLPPELEIVLASLAAFKGIEANLGSSPQSSTE